jgi:hypothetical protein
MRSNLHQRVLNLEKSSHIKSQDHIWFYDDRTEIYSTNENGRQKNRLYIPSSTGELFDKDDSFVQLVMGPYGSGKTTMCLHKIVKMASMMPKWSNGRRKSRWIIIRNTSPELHSTTLKSWISWFGELGDIKPRQKPILTYEHVFRDQEGVIELELMFIALDREDDIRKLKSLEATGAYINELSEVPQAVLSHLKGRLNHRYPSRSFCNEYYWSGILSDTNPPDEDHWIFKDFELNNVPGYKIFKQPPGLIKNDDNEWKDNKESDNAINLAHEHPNQKGVLVYDYYEKLSTGQSDEFIKVYCLGQYGLVGNGKKVYPEYNDDLHSKEEVESIQGEPLILGWDGGLTPACVVTQLSPRGQLLILKEYTSQDMGIRTFAESIVIPGLKKDFPYNPKIGISRADPSGVKRDEIMAQFSFIGELNALGIETLPASTNDIETRVSAVRFFLNRMVDGKPGFLISRKNCPMLRKGFIKDYVYKRVAVAGDERYKDKPDKNMASHPHDALQYSALEVASDYLVTPKDKLEKINMYTPVMRIGI